MNNLNFTNLKYYQNILLNKLLNNRFNIIFNNKHQTGVLIVQTIYILNYIYSNVDKIVLILDDNKNCDILYSIKQFISKLSPELTNDIIVNEKSITFPNNNILLCDNNYNNNSIDLLYMNYSEELYKSYSILLPFVLLTTDSQILISTNVDCKLLNDDNIYNKIIL